jgi:diguanylate cyclase (GGDEF)-like protein
MTPWIQDWQTEVGFFVRWLEILKAEMEHQSKEAAAAPLDVTTEERVHIYYVVHDYLQADQNWPCRIDDPDELMAELEEALKRQLSRISIGEDDPDGNIKAFILSAPYEDVLTLLQTLPLVPLLIADTHRPRSPLRDWDEFFVRLSQRIGPVINDVLEKTSSPARFTENGEFHREGLGTTSPLALLRLPTREVLFRDVTSVIRNGKTVSVVFLDLDGFKQVNDKLGHAAGDKCLERVAEILGSLAVNRGKVYRYGGDEFVLLLPNAISIEAAATAERLRTSIERAKVGGAVSVTASVGVIGSDAFEASTAEELVDAADKAAYASKHSGKNKVTVGPVASESR